MALPSASEIKLARATRTVAAKDSAPLDDAGKARLAVIEGEIEAALKAATTSPIIVTATKADVTNDALVDAVVASGLASGWSITPRKGREGKPIQWEVRKAKAKKAAPAVSTEGPRE